MLYCISGKNTKRIIKAKRKQNFLTFTEKNYQMSKKSSKGVKIREWLSEIFTSLIEVTYILN